MSSNYKLKEVRVDLLSGVSLFADVESIEGVKSLLKDISSAKLQVKGVEEKSQIQSEHGEGGDLNSRVETKANLTNGILRKSNIVAFKDNVPQLLRPSIFTNITDALLVLLFAVEAGLQKAKIDYDSFKGLYEAQNIKSGTPMRILLSNLRASGYLDKKAYSTDKSLTLTAKGEKKAIEVLQEYCR